MAWAAVLLATKVFGDVAHRSVLLVGSGQIAQLAANQFRAARAGPIRVSDPHPGRAQLLASQLGAQVTDFDAVHTSVASADIVLCSTASSKYVFTKKNLSPGLRLRRFRPLLILDLAVPTEIAPNLGELESVFAYNMCDIQRVVDRIQSRVSLPYRPELACECNDCEQPVSNRLRSDSAESPLPG
jgi:glutamyl-tRNA reductase